MRTDLYGLVHKAQRYFLFDLGQRLSRADLEDEATRGAMADEVRSLVAHLEDHAANEERYIHPLFRQLGDAAAPLIAQHDELAEHLHDLSALVAANRWPELYPAVMRFIGRYLLHLDQEERAQAEVLWPAFTDAQLGGVFARFKAERPPAAARTDLEQFLPALNVPELARLVRGLEEGLAEPQRGDVLADVRQRLGDARWMAVEGRLGQR